MKPNRFRFRAWDKELRKMIRCDHLYVHLEQDTIELPHSSFVLMQSTGLSDKNGVEIFEGDVLKRFDPKRPSVDFGCVRVVWKAAKCKLTFEADGYTMNPEDSSGLTIVGNIHQHPYLLR